jgi:outer membrane receptor protein involved in Fe transport
MDSKQLTSTPKLIYTELSGKTDGSEEISGITQLHQGAEVEATYKVNKFLELQGMFSWGDYKYKGNATGANFQDDNTPIETNGSNTSTLYLDKVKVGGTNNSVPQTTASLGFTATPVNDLRVYGNWQYTGRVYSAMNVNDFLAPGKDALQLPDFNLFNIGASYKIKLKNPNQYFTIGANVYNLLDTTYIQDGVTNIKSTDAPAKLADGTNNTAKKTYEELGYIYKGIATDNRVFFGFGRTWSTSLSFNF